MQVVVNPGSGPVGAATEQQAEANIAAFVADLTARGHENITTARKADADYDADDHDGRFCWTVAVGGSEAIEVQMPGIPLQQVRWLGPDQDIWQFPRLYVEDGSWIWFFALNCFLSEEAETPSPDNTAKGGEPYRFETFKPNANPR